MKPGLSIQIVWALAAQESIIAEFEFIEPPHFFLGVLKFAELEEQQVEQVVSDPALVREMLREQDDIRSRLRDCSIKVPDQSRGIRYSLRRRLGMGGHPHDAQRVIHRSTAAREICRKAEDAARTGHSSKWCALHLFDVLPESPTCEIKDVLKEAGVSGPGNVIDTPYLDRYGQDLSASAFGRRGSSVPVNKTDISKDPICKVLIDDILGSKKTNVLLIQKGERSPEVIVKSIAEYFARDTAPSNEKGKRIVGIDISKNAWKTRSVESRKLENRMNALFQEAIKADNIVLFLSELYEYLETKTGANFSDLLTKLLSAETVQCICGIDETNYHRYIKKDPELKKLLRPVWIHDLKVPFQL